MDYGKFDWREYFKWLVNIVKGNDEDWVDFLPVLLYLNEKEFNQHHYGELDENRSIDGKLLRVRYAEEMGEECSDEDLDKPCSVLELLIGLAVHIENNITGYPGEERPDIWFWSWLNNLGIDEKCTGRGYHRAYLDQVIDDWLNRQYTIRGKGSPFPVKHGNQRKKDMWMQAMAYINETMRYW